ncbi:CHAD domain-containing protein [Mangrovibacterium marinum]|uniref:CHAD domain-containing protein n=1 Tax=Mangrovibacterium marinum TaxID=1639118 RepID=A0A2T5C5I4_9BACT|nr:CHAD domain-containing protein [Mangrovibacterium marinum]PTN10169.1 CHAD domain-containing protein [Mangrovibacterium marinum]
MANSLATEYLRHSRRFLKYLDYCRSRLNEKNIHQLRTSLKRQLCFVKFYGLMAQQPDVLVEAKSAIAGIYKTAGAIREQQLNSQLSQRLLATTDKAYLRQLEQAEQLYREAMKQELAAFDTTSYRKQLSRMARRMRSASEALLCRQAQAFVGQKVEKINQLLSFRTDDERYHACRKHLKQTAFMILYLGSAHGCMPLPDWGDRFKKIDLLIGHWHDCQQFQHSYNQAMRTHRQPHKPAPVLRAMRKLKRSNAKRIAALHRQLNRLLPALAQAYRTA